MLDDELGDRLQKGADHTVSGDQVEIQQGLRRKCRFQTVLSVCGLKKKWSRSYLVGVCKDCWGGEKLGQTDASQWLQIQGVGFSATGCTTQLECEAEEKYEFLWELGEVSVSLEWRVW